MTTVTQKNDTISDATVSNESVWNDVYGRLGYSPSDTTIIGQETAHVGWGERGSILGGIPAQERRGRIVALPAGPRLHMYNMTYGVAVKFNHQTFTVLPASTT